MSLEICEGCGERVVNPIRLATGEVLPYCTWACKQKEGEEQGWKLLQASLPHVKSVVRESEKPPVYLSAEGNNITLTCGACLLPTPVWGARKITLGKWIRFRTVRDDPESGWTVRLTLRTVDGCPDCQYAMAQAAGRAAEGHTVFLPEPEHGMAKVSRLKATGTGGRRAAPSGKKVVWE